MSTIRRLSDDDVRAIFESLHGDQQPPPDLKFRIVPVGPNGLKLSPPSYEFEGTNSDCIICCPFPLRSCHLLILHNVRLIHSFISLFISDGLYVLLQPDKKRKNHHQWVPDSSKIPSHLKDLTLTNFTSQTCPWSLSGPQFPQPTAIQQRYCYPKGNHDYSSRKGGALWTMYERNGKEDVQFRLLHVYFSAKRAINRGVNVPVDDPQRRQTPTSTPRRRRRAASGRSARSPYSQSACTTPRSIHTTVTESPLHLPNQVRTFHPMSLGDIPRIDERNESIFVSPYASVPEFLGHPFHPIPSFDLDSFDPNPFLEPDFALMEHNFQKDGHRSSSYRNTLDEVNQTQILMDVDSVEDVDSCWKDPIFSIVMKSSIDDNDDACESLQHKLQFLRQRIGDMIATASGQGPAVDIVVTWARSVATSPLEVPNDTTNRSRTKLETSESNKAPIQVSSKSKRKNRRRHLLAEDGKEMPWSVLEDALICRLRSSQGPHWSMISPFLPGRTVIDVKSRYQFLKNRFIKCLKSVTLTTPLVEHMQALKQSTLIKSTEVDVNILQHLADYIANGTQSVLDGDYTFGPFRRITSTGELCTRCGLVMPSFETGRSICEKTGWCETCTQLSACVSGNYLRQIHMVKKTAVSPEVKQEYV
jgi:hypothetical protein